MQTTTITEYPAHRDGQWQRGQIAFPELGNGTDDLQPTNLTPLRDSPEKDQLFRAQDAESRMEHPTFAKHLRGLVAEA